MSKSKTEPETPYKILKEKLIKKTTTREKQRS